MKRLHKILGAILLASTLTVSFAYSWNFFVGHRPYHGRRVYRRTNFLRPFFGTVRTMMDIQHYNQVKNYFDNLENQIEDFENKVAQKLNDLELRIVRLEEKVK